jgi:hypothetical protein
MPNFSQATDLLDRIDAELVGQRVHHAVSDSPIADLLSAASSAASSAADSLSDQVAEVTGRRRERRAGRIAVIVAVVGVVVAIGVIVSRRRSSTDDVTSEDHLRPGAANPN